MSSKAELAKLRNSAENQKRLEDLRKLSDAEQINRNAVAKIFDPVALIARANEIHEVVHPPLGLIRFGELKLSDTELVNQCKGEKARSAMAIYIMLKKAYPDLPDYTPETIDEFYRAFPMLEGGLLLEFLSSQPCFLGKKSASGSMQMQPQTM